MRHKPVSKPFAGFDDFDGCVRAHDGEVEDPEAFCAWLQEEAKDALSDPSATEVLTSLTSEFVSSVDTPAQDSEWILMKDADTPRRKAREIERPYVFPESGSPDANRVKGEDPCQDGWVMVGTKPNENGSGEVPRCVPEEDVDDPPDINSALAGLPDDFDPSEWRNRSKSADVDVRATNADGEKQLAYAAVLIPNTPDKQGDVIPPYVVERSAHEYMAEYRKMDSDHDLEDGAGVPVESWILKSETSFETPDGDSVTYPAGTWLMGKRFVDDEWERVKSGELTGFSIYGAGTPIDVDDLRDAVERSASKSDQQRNMKIDPIEKALSSDTPKATLRHEIAKAEYDDKTVKEMVDVLNSACDMLKEGMEGGEEEVEDAEHGDDEDDEDDDEDESMKDEDGTPEDGGTNEAPSDDQPSGLPDDTPEWAKSIHDTAKSTEEAVGGIRDDVDSLRGRVDDLEKEVVEDPAPENDRMEADDGEGDRMKSVEKKVDQLYEAIDADPDEDADVVRKGIREQANKPDEDDQTSTESYAGIVEEETKKSTATGGVEGNPRLSGDD